jgi:Fic family protein
MNYSVKLLPPSADLESKAILKKLASAHRYLAELKGVAATIPNEGILINTLTLQEAKDSSAIENIITTHDELFKAQISDFFKSPAAKEVRNYSNALKRGFDLVRSKKILTNGDILQIQEELEQNNAGYRKQAGTTLKNLQTGEIVYTPPQDYETILSLMSNLEKAINDETLFEADPLVKMAVIHFQFESIHPFYDGNGRTGRIINILYLLIKNLLHLPILYMSRYIMYNKANYYRFLQLVRDEEKWEDWILFMLDAIEKTAYQTILIINQMRDLMQDYKHRIREQLPRIYTQDLLNNLFRHPYTKIEFVMEDLKVSRLTATRYLDKLTEKGFLAKQRVGRSNFYINTPLYQLFTNSPPPNDPGPDVHTVNT